MKFFAPLLFLSALVAALPNTISVENVTLPETSMTETQWLAHAAKQGVEVFENSGFSKRNTFPLGKRTECGLLFACSGGCGCTSPACTRWWGCRIATTNGCAGCVDLCHYK